MMEVGSRRSFGFRLVVLCVKTPSKSREERCWAVYSFRGSTWFPFPVISV